MKAISVDAIFFDVDGTMVDARKDIVNAMNVVIKKLKMPPRAGEEIISYRGTGVRDLVHRSLYTTDRRIIDKGVDIFSRYYSDHATDNSKLYLHVKSVLRHFKDKRKFVITNRFERFADITLREFGIREYFEEILGGDDENCLKPSACVLDRAMSRLRLERRRSIIVGDMAIDVETGKNSGIKTCFVTYGLGKLEDLRKSMKPDYIIDDLIELKDIIK